ncbi:NADPH2:quinone reductase [Herbihabitans rhizosphaerae]|uniref:NADPH2:quinone reductase n=1 Tax=Herbihabitans rhizosphaerae TaxID=1872711 RepID=A0A4Q7KQ90_9PSEU|nr:zinc-binding dehydrogenase [Herbihabitans rhizosphaerae]RZS38988.1 NADPH2:quinone reductase [Herbihabitans rhizosphaerae]
MRAVRVDRFGGPDTLVTNEVPDPVAGPGQVVVQVAAADVLFVETQIRAGAWGDVFGMEPPYLPGGGVAGTVRAVGEGVSDDWIGRVVATPTADRAGGYAELALAPADGLVPVPDGLATHDAAALVHDGPTALTLFDDTGMRPGDQVLLTGAAGAAAVLVVQLARAAGARVVAAARGRRKLELLTELGADVVVDYAEPDWIERVLVATGEGPDIVLDGVGGAIGAAAFEITARGGQFSAHGAPSGGFAPIDPDEARRREIRLRGIAELQVSPERLTSLLTRALAGAAAGTIKPVIGQTFPLEKAADAHSAIEAREVLGKTLLLV